MYRRLWWGLVLFITACRSPITPPPIFTPAPPAPPLRIGLASSAAALSDLVTGPYTDQTDRAAPQFVLANNATLFADLAGGHLDAILVHHIPETSVAWFNPVALDGLALVVHPDNPVQELNLGQVGTIFNGRITHWSDINGLDQPITLVSRESGAGTRLIFQQRLMAEQRLSINALIQADDQALLDVIAADPAAIGYTMMGTALAADVKLLVIEGIAPAPAQTAAQQYPLSVPLYFVAPAEPEGDLRAFLAWLQSDDGQGVIGERYGRVKP